MAIQRWDPLRDLLHLRDRMNRLFEESLTRSGATYAQMPMDASEWTPPVDIVEDSGRFVLRADLPGVEPSDVEVQVENGCLVLSGERRPHADSAPEAYLRRERPAGRFFVRIAMPDSVDAQRIQATHRSGVLEVALPKKEEQTPGRIRIAVE